ncbi:MAG: N-6 DNA methylase, partial [Myxococcales bacterium]|nr:N-6 DNA methylase [Myxococcales bacterium]
MTQDSPILSSAQTNPDPVALTCDYLDQHARPDWADCDLLIARLCPNERSTRNSIGTKSSAIKGSRPTVRSGIDLAWGLVSTLESHIDRRVGLFSTPRNVSRAMAGGLFEGNRSVAAVADPASGYGSLLVAAVEAAQRAGSPMLADQLTGTDVRVENAAISQASVWLALDQPDIAPARFGARDIISEGLPDIGADAAWLANPPWGSNLRPDHVSAWKQRNRELANVLEGSIDIFLLFLLELVADEAQSAVITPMQWMHRLSHTRARQWLASNQRLRAVLTLRKGIFSAAPDVVPTISWWNARTNPPSGPVRVAWTGWKATLPESGLLPVQREGSLDPRDWTNAPFSVLPALLDGAAGDDGMLQLMLGQASR